VVKTPEIALRSRSDAGSGFPREHCVIFNMSPIAHSLFADRWDAAVPAIPPLGFIVEDDFDAITGPPARDPVEAAIDRALQST
jgi:hypothetical protein